MGSLSRRVMDMKFMKGPEKTGEKTGQNEPKLVKDSSEWTSPYYHQLIAKKRQDTDYVGFASINELDEDDSDLRDDVDENVGRNLNMGRKVWGEKAGSSLEGGLDISKLKDGITQKATKNDKKRKLGSENSYAEHSETETRQFLGNLLSKVGDLESEDDTRKKDLSSALKKQKRFTKES